MEARTNIFKLISMRTWCFRYFQKSIPQGDIVMIRCIFSLVAHDYKDQIFKLVLIFRNLHGSVGNYINFSIGVTLQQFVAFKFVKICVFRTHPSFSCFYTGYNFEQISRKCRGIFQRHKRWNVDGRNAMQFQKFNFLSLRMHKRFAWKCDVCH